VHHREHASSAFQLPVRRRRWSSQASPSVRQQTANTAKPRIWASVSRDVPVYSPSRYEIQISL